MGLLDVYDPYEYSPRAIALAVMAHKDGDSNAQISRDLGIARDTVKRWLSDYFSGRLRKTHGSHSHLWVLTSPSKLRPTRGVCMICWKERGDFQNSLDPIEVWKTEERQNVEA